MSKEKEINYLELSDEDYLNLPPPSSKPPVEEDPEEIEEVEKEEEVKETVPNSSSETDDEEFEEDVLEEQEVEDNSKEEPKTKVGKPSDSSEDEETTEETQEVKDTINYQEFYEAITKPFRANGKEIQAKNHEEAIRLMQMGAGYGKKMQELQPYLKIAKMLENNGLMNEESLSFLIDVSKNKPEAIKTLLQQNKINPLDIDIDEKSNYRPSNYSVGDNEVEFTLALRQLNSTREGQEIIREIDATWDNVSLKALREHPELFDVIQEQKASGTYQRIASEIDRMKTMGYIPQNTPFLEAYKNVGEILTRSLGNTPVNVKQNLDPKVVNTNRVLDTRPVAPKPKVSNNDRARAASSTKTIPVKVKTTPNFLEMSDEDFNKLPPL